MMPTLICDFCSAPNPVMEYPCRSFGLTGERALKPDTPVTRQGGFQWAKEQDLCLSSATTFRSLGSWAACEACHRLIEQGQIEALVQRVAAIFRETDPRLNDTVEDLRFTFLFFDEVRTGPPIPIP